MIFFQHDCQFFQHDCQFVQHDCQFVQHDCRFSSKVCRKSVVRGVIGIAFTYASTFMRRCINVMYPLDDFITISVGLRVWFGVQVFTSVLCRWMGPLGINRFIKLYQKSLKTLNHRWIDVVSTLRHWHWIDVVSTLRYWSWIDVVSTLCARWVYAVFWKKKATTRPIRTFVAG